MNDGIRRAVIAAIYGMLLAVTGPAWAQSSGGAPSPDPALGVMEDWSTWIGELEKSAQKVRSLRQITADLEDEVSRMRSRRYPRGEERARLEAAYERARTQLEEAEAAHPALLEQARQAGVPQGILQDFEEIPAAGS